MPILISYDSQDFETHLSNGGQLALYAVPTEYSEDGLFLAVWYAGELEPCPACASADARPLLRLAVQDGQLREDFKAEGVSYA